MPLKLKISDEYNTTVLVWQLIEDISHFELALKLSSEDQSLLNTFSPKRKLEWLSTRYLLKLVLKDFGLENYKKDKYGKPFIEGFGGYISISHSHDHAAIIVSDKIVGIDIQKLHENIERISHKFISEREMIYTQNDKKLLHMHINWGAKEAMYKGYGKKELGFIRHMSIEPYIYHAGTTSFRGTVNKNEIIENYNLFTKNLNDYVLVYAIQI